MPSGSSSTGRKIPKMPGSNSAGEDSTGTSACRANGDPARTAARMRRQRTHQKSATVRNPQIQIANKMIGIGFSAEGSVIGAVGTETAGAVNGRLIWSIAMESPDAELAGAVDDPKWLPIATSSENGMRNFTEAISQSQ